MREGDEVKKSILYALVSVLSVLIIVCVLRCSQPDAKAAAPAAEQYEPRFTVQRIENTGAWSYYVKDNSSGAEFIVFCRDGCAIAQLPLLPHETVGQK